MILSQIDANKVVYNMLYAALTEASKTPQEFTLNAVVFGEAFIMQGIVLLTKQLGLQGEQTLREING